MTPFTRSNALSATGSACRYLVALFLILPSLGRAQGDIENLVVETYYVSDLNDATDTIGGGLVTGSTTYRVFIDLCDGCSLRALYGDENHPLTISSTEPFFNHLDRGRTYGHEINNSALDEGTTALDSWLSLGTASNQRRGIPKAEDPDGSLVGGANNDGGSAPIAEGLLVNMTPAMGFPLTERDGLVPLDGGVALPPNFNVTGDDPGSVFLDSTIGSDYSSNNVRIGCATPGMVGPTADNRILLAQLTTAGELSFKLNVEVQRSNGSVFRYVADDTLLTLGEIPSGFLTYPPQCGCMDPDFLEYDPSAGCDDGSCATAIIYGCLDTLACNYDPAANFNIGQLCCYGPADCNGLDISIVCPTLGLTDAFVDRGRIGTYPNPADNELIIDLRSNAHMRHDILLLDPSGRVIQEWPSVQFVHGVSEVLDVSDLPAGPYFLIIHGPYGRDLLKLIIH